MPIIEDVRDYWDSRSAGFSDAVMEEYSERGEEIYRAIAEATGIGEGSRVLDVGCGPGLLSIVMSEHGASVTGIDYSEKMVAQARRNAESKGLPAEFMKMDAQDMDFDDCSFDAVVSRDMLWSLPEPERAYAEMVRVLVPGGRGFVTDGNYYLRLFDSRYDIKRPEPAEGRPNLHEAHNKDHVDFNIMTEIARNLPLSRVERPMWDLATLCRLGVGDVSYHIRTLDSENGRLIMRFSETFTKEGSL